MCKTCIPSVSNAPVQIDPKQRIEASAKRSMKLTRARAKNLKYYISVNEYVNQLPEQTDKQYLHQYRKRLITCASTSLYRRLNKSRECSLITSAVCNHRLCNVCNMLRSKKLRKKWRNFLTDTEQNVPIRKQQAHFFGLENHWQEDVYFTSGADILQRFDLMHLTLTVPHENGKWNNQEYYAKELLKKFNEMRKAEWWTDTVFGGEYSIETTKNNDGLHIHIHALLFVDKNLKRSRNFLHHNIALRWNALTVDKFSTKDKVLKGDRRKGIEQSFAYLKADYDEVYFDDFMLDLDGRGATMVGLKSLYYEVGEADASNYSKKYLFKGDNGKLYHYCRSGNPASILKGVVECLKYHFEPCAMEDSDGNLDLEMVASILPNIYRQRLYGKFGGFFKVTALNVLEQPMTERDMLEDTMENATEAFDPRTGTEITKDEFFYAIADANSIVHDVNRKHYYLERGKIKKVISPHDAGTLAIAVKYLVHYAYRQRESYEIPDKVRVIHD